MRMVTRKPSRVTLEANISDDDGWAVDFADCFLPFLPLSLWKSFVSLHKSNKSYKAYIR